ncbi:hypothetical protein YC2023_081841 [Brassica napus]
MAFQASIYGIWRKRNGRRHLHPPHSALYIARTVHREMQNRLIALQVESGDEMEHQDSAALTSVHHHQRKDQEDQSLCFCHVSLHVFFLQKQSILTRSLSSDFDMCMHTENFKVLYFLVSHYIDMNESLQENSGILTDIPTENDIFGISRGISEDIPRKPRKPKIWFPRNFLGIYRRNSEEISIRRNILMKYRGKMCSSAKTDEFRGNIIAVGEPLGDFTKFRGNSDDDDSKTNYN